MRSGIEVVDGAFESPDNHSGSVGLNMGGKITGELGSCKGC